MGTVLRDTISLGNWIISSQRHTLKERTVPMICGIKEEHAMLLQQVVDGIF